MRLAATLFLLACTTVPATAQTTPESAEFSDWSVVCERYPGCAAAATADTTAPTGETLGARLILSRDNYATYWQISVETTPRLPAENTAFTIAVDGESLTFSPPDEVGAYDALNRFYLLGAKAQDLMDKLVPGAMAELSLNDSTGETLRGEISLSGLAAAMLWIDEKQERLGSERVAGEPPEGEVLITHRAPEPPSENLMALHSASEDCEPLEDLPSGDIESYRIDGEYTLHLVPCWAGAYNFGARIYTEDRDHNVRHHLFAGYSDYLGWTGESELVNAWYDDVSQTLSMIYRGRGIGDCGSSGLWKWTGSNFRLLEFAHKGECDMQGDPGEFPVVYRAPGYVSPYGE